MYAAIIIACLNATCLPAIHPAVFDSESDCESGMEHMIVNAVGRGLFVKQAWCEEVN